MTTLTSFPMVLASFGSAVLGWLMFFLSVFLILLILVQRGKGGGLTGALGGPGGQSAFGSKAGDMFTVITAVSAVIWGLVCAIAMYTMGVPPLTADDADFQTDQPPAITSPVDPAGEGAAAGGLSGLSGLLSDDPAGDTGESATEVPSEETPETGTPSAELESPETEPEAGEESSDQDAANADPSDSDQGEPNETDSE